MGNFFTADDSNNNKNKKYAQFGDEFSNIEQVQEALRRAGLESSNLILGVDFTKSNEWSGRYTFSGRSLHHLSEDELNPYEQAISIVGRTLSEFDEDDLIPCFGFGDVTTKANSVFSFYHDGKPCKGFQEALQRYRTIAEYVQPSGPTSFAPIIKAAMDIVEKTGGQYHVLLIIADGQVSSTEEQDTIKAIVEASKLALSIVLVGVGDGPWDKMKEFDDHIPERNFDNFQFVNFAEVMKGKGAPEQKEALFALAALMEIPSQFKATMELKLLGQKTTSARRTVPLPPPRSY